MKTGKKILLLTPSLSKGGAEKQLIKIALHLRAKGYQVRILSLKPINEFSDSIRSSGLSVVFLKDWYYNPIANFSALFKEFSDFKPTIVISFMFIAIIFARLLKSHFHFKLISSIRISVLPVKWYLPFRITGGDDAVVYNSTASRQVFEKQHPRLKPGTVIHNEITLPKPRLKPAAPRNLFTWVCIGHFRWNKDYATLFRAISKTKNKNFRVFIIGALNGVLWPELLIEELKLQHIVKLCGCIKDPEPYLAAGDAFVLSSFSEGMPNATLEAMAMAKPVVVTDIDGNRELIGAAGCGFLSQPRNANDLAACMDRMMEMSEEDRKTLGDQGRSYVAQHFNKKGVMGQWVNLVEQV